MAKPNATALRRFDQQIEDEANVKKRGICDKYEPLELNSAKIVKSGKGKLRSSSHIRTKLDPNNWKGSEVLYIKDIFDIEKEILEIEVTNRIRKKMRVSFISEVNNIAEDIINKAYFEGTDLTDAIKKFKKMEF